MRVLITGAGEVGFLIASELYADHDVTVIDRDAAACARLQNMDVKVLHGNSADARLLLEAEIKKADIVVAATGNDEVNVITCIIASHLGVRQTIARVSNPQYIDQPVQDRKEIGISYMICPELAMAEDMAKSLYFPSLLMNRDLAKGLVELIEFKVIREMNIEGPIENIRLPDNCRVVAINRAGEIFIPKEKDSVNINDHLLLLCDSQALPALKEMLHESRTSQRVMIVGGGMVGFYLASLLEKMGVDVRLIELDAERCGEIADKLSGTMILNGDGSDLALLKEEDAGKMDVVFAVTGLDDKNLLCSLLVKQLGARKILSRVNRSAYIKLFEMVGVDRAVSPGQVTADAVLQRVIGGEEVITLSDERMELVDFVVQPKAKIIGKTLSQELPHDSMAGMVIRDGVPTLPGGDFKAAVGDRIFVMSLPHAVSKVKKLFISR
ncbi:MAG TPA: Trk system potassium transporter TrkA [Methanothrix sp.]|jgi:trk system potassium uptake protein TrkA|nr:Trk system potassium transporter TrkA [Methanothrix sp.]HOV81863.1 Trk system potassium transporter TrkA [Methanothrix sp.]HPC89685.1 Trk system potassium transporter TrkA [Methanothrix sp.]HQE87643.1 Trk system potassium transporter TrkA [Methanothrix sp.]HQI68524.1 Trk system potassium transporter TrkA [Methanothrix sp.]